ncbi:hypothetical protein ACLOJK_026034 [Asimina triloba]
MERAGRGKRVSSVCYGSPVQSNGLTSLDPLWSSISTASVIAVGDEILLINDDLRHCVPTSIKIDSVAEEVEQQKSNNDLVFVFGGVGPLHSDVSVAGVAKAFGVRLAPDEEFEERLRQFIGEHYTGDRNEMAQLPEGISELLHHELLPVPLIKCENVIVLSATNVTELDQQWDCLLELSGENGPVVLKKPFMSKQLTVQLPDFKKLSSNKVEGEKIICGLHTDGAVEKLDLVHSLSVLWGRARKLPPYLRKQVGIVIGWKKAPRFYIELFGSNASVDGRKSSKTSITFQGVGGGPVANLRALTNLGPFGLAFPYLQNRPSIFKMLSDKGLFANDPHVLCNLRFVDLGFFCAFSIFYSRARYPSKNSCDSTLRETGQVSLLTKFGWARASNIDTGFENGMAELLKNRAKDYDSPWSQVTTREKKKKLDVFTGALVQTDANRANTTLIRRHPREDLMRRNSFFHYGSSGIFGPDEMSFPAPRRNFRSSFRRNDRRAFPENPRDCHPGGCVDAAVPSIKRKRPFDCVNYWHLDAAGTMPSTSRCFYPVPASVRADSLPKRDRGELRRDDGDQAFMSRDEIERCSPSRKDGIDVMRETHLRYSYCAFLQNLGMRLELPQTTIGTAMILCHRFFVRRSHACHDRFLVATAALFLAAKSEETPCPLNTVLKVSYEICHKQDLTFFPYLLPADWFDQYRERVLEAEQMILTTLNFELNVQHPYIPLTAVLNKLGLSQTALVNLAWNLVNEGCFLYNRAFIVVHHGNYLLVLVPLSKVHPRYGAGVM